MTRQVAKVADKAEATKDQASADQREVPTIKSSALRFDFEGQATRSAFVRLPEGALLQDLQDCPTMWRLVQQMRHTALQKFDKVTAVAFTEEWMIKDCVVVEADQERVVLAIRPGDRISMPTQTGTSWEDSTYQIRWAGSGFGVFRRDGVPVLPAHYASVDLAKAELFRTQYNRTAP